MNSYQIWIPFCKGMTDGPSAISSFIASQLPSRIASQQVAFDVDAAPDDQYPSAPYTLRLTPYASISYAL